MTRLEIEHDSLFDYSREVFLEPPPCASAHGTAGANTSSTSTSTSTPSLRAAPTTWASTPPRQFCGSQESPLICVSGLDPSSTCPRASPSPFSSTPASSPSLWSTRNPSCPACCPAFDESTRTPQSGTTPCRHCGWPRGAALSHRAGTASVAGPRQDDSGDWRPDAAGPDAGRGHRRLP